MAYDNQLLKKIIKISFKSFVLQMSLIFVSCLIIIITFFYSYYVSEIPFENWPDNALKYEYEIDMPINEVCANMEKIAESKPYLVTYENNAEKVIEMHDIIQSRSEESAYCYIYIKCIDNYIGFYLSKYNDKTLVGMNDNLYTGLFDVLSSQYFIITEILSDIGPWQSRFTKLIVFSVYFFLIGSYAIVPIFILLVIETIVIVVCGGILVYKKIRYKKEQRINSILEK